MSVVRQMWVGARSGVEGGGVAGAWKGRGGEGGGGWGGGGTMA